MRLMKNKFDTVRLGLYTIDPPMHLFDLASRKMSRSPLLSANTRLGVSVRTPVYNIVRVIKGVKNE